MFHIKRLPVSSHPSTLQLKRHSDVPDFSIYYMPGFQFFIILITEFFSVTLGQTLASITHSPFISTQFNPYLLQSKLLPLTVVRFALIRCELPDLLAVGLTGLLDRLDAAGA
ncbi:PR domain zinc finger protein 10 [Fusarium oxysporum f. sp. albedinis]|nr:PR domain zinc finger protein 10 [Fusarium oxysporum f. sp. albedinis]